MTVRLLRMANGMGMPEIGVGPESLREAAKGSREMAGELRAVDSHTADRIKQAMRGSGAALNAHKVGAYWDEKMKQLSSALDERSDKLVAAADEYDSGEREKSADFDGLNPEARRPGGN